MENLNEDFKVLNELIRTAYKLISPISYHDDLKRLTPEFMNRDYVKTPGCYLAVGDGNNNTLFPICNRFGYKDPDIIRFSLKLATKMKDNLGSDQRDIPGVIVKLEKMLNKYDKPSPNTRTQSILRGKSTKAFHKKVFDNKELLQDVQEGLASSAGVLLALYQTLRPMVIDFMQTRDAEKKEELRQKIATTKEKIAKVKQQQAAA